MPPYPYNLQMIDSSPHKSLIDACNYDGTSLGLNAVNPSTNHSQNLSGLLSPVTLAGFSLMISWQSSWVSPQELMIESPFHQSLLLRTQLAIIHQSNLVVRQVGNGGKSFTKRWSAQDKAQSILKHLDKHPTLTKPLKALAHQSLSEPHQT
ncbi:hypothetical protein BY996DRAFT_6541154 [Phakopsora pachyrhizi]|nr:hypothetical protein BY996DRAFT_6541154 [Phakopsora pachyrhizi]